jgi:hypothetical protein
MVAAYLSDAYTMKTIAAYFGVHYSTLSRAIRNSGRREIQVSLYLRKISPYHSW